MPNVEARVIKQRCEFMVKKAHNQWELLLPPLLAGAEARLKAYADCRIDIEGIGGTYIVDAEQWSGKNSGGAIFQCQLTHGEIVSFKLQRSALALVHMVAQMTSHVRCWRRS